MQVAPKSYGVPKTAAHEHEAPSDDLELHHHPIPDSYGAPDHVISTPATSKYEAPKVKDHKMIIIKNNLKIWCFA